MKNNIQNEDFITQISALLDDYTDVEPDSSIDLTEDMERLSRPAIMNKLAFYYCAGLPYRQIADILCVTPTAIRKTVQTTEFKSIVGAIESDVIERCKSLIKIGAAKATTTMIELLSDASPKVRFSAAKDILNRSGMAVVAKVTIQKQINQFANLTDEQILTMLNKNLAKPPETLVEGVEENSELGNTIGGNTPQSI